MENKILDIVRKLPDTISLFKQLENLQTNLDLIIDLSVKLELENKTLKNEKIKDLKLLEELTIKLNNCNFIKI